MLRDGQRVVGVYLAFYSERFIADQVERFCNLGSWSVLPEYRLHSVRLLKALLAQDGYHFTDLAPSEKVESVNARLKFRYLDTSMALLPAPALAHGAIAEPRSAPTPMSLPALWSGRTSNCTAIMRKQPQ